MKIVVCFAVAVGITEGIVIAAHTNWWTTALIGGAFGFLAFIAWKAWAL